MSDEGLFEKVHNLSDLELAVLLCLIGKEHCLISTPPAALDSLTHELQLISRNTFGLNCVVVNCDKDTTLDTFSSALLHHQSPPSHPPIVYSSSYFVPQPRSRSSLSPTTALTIANVILAQNLHLAPPVIQVQALELLRTGRIFTRTSVQTTPKQFLFIPVLAANSGGEARLGKYLNDAFMVGHWHDPEDGYVNLEEERDKRHENDDDDDDASTSSVVKPVRPGEALVSEQEIKHLAHLSTQVAIDIDITRYMMNIVAFLRLHRAVTSGISPAATKHLDQLIRYLAPLHGTDFVTPALVGLAVRKVYTHRIQMTTPDKERSIQWGSSLNAVKAMLEGVSPENIIEEVLELVTTPL